MLFNPNFVIKCIVLSLGVISALHAEIINDTVTVDGKQVDMQKFSIECSFYDIGDAETVAWEKKNRTYTVHLIDTAALPYGKEVRPEANGFYNWHTGKWSSFASIDENMLWLVKENSQFLTSEEIYRKDKLRKYIINIYDYRIGLSRSDLSMTTSYDDMNCSVEIRGYQMRDRDCDKFMDFSKWKIPSDEGKCNSIPYKQPAQRIGF